jgi:serine/threonine protein kinase
MTNDPARRIDLGGGRAYELLGEIGAGGMGTVYLGHSVGIGGFQRRVAVKLCHARLASDLNFRRMFLDEARLAASIQHPNVVATFDVGETPTDDHGTKGETGRGETVPYIVMDYIEGAHVFELESALYQGQRPMPVDVALRIALDVLAGLHAAHEFKDSKGNPSEIVHRDVSPDNIVVGIDGVSRILDFGIARAAARLSTTKDGQLKGKVAYMTPEQLSTRDVGRYTDIYASAVVLWQLLAGSPLYDGDTEGDIIAQILRGNVPSIRQRRGDVSDALDAVVRKAAHRIKERRYATAAEFAEAIEATGAPIATNRVVGAFVAEVAREHIEKNRAILIAHEARAAQRHSQEPGSPSKTGAEAGDARRTPARSPVTTAGLGSPSSAVRYVAAAIAVLLAAIAMFYLANSSSGTGDRGPNPSPEPRAQGAPGDPAKSPVATPAPTADAAVARDSGAAVPPAQGAAVREPSPAAPVQVESGRANDTAGKHRKKKDKVVFPDDI